MAGLTSVPESQFAYVVVVSRRARQLMMGGRPLVDNPKSRKTSRIAEEELQQGLLEYDPFVRIDAEGVGELVRIAVERGRRVRPKIKLGICGEHGGDPASVRFCQEAGLDYVSCSPYRVPIARLAAAQAALAKATLATTA